MCFPHFPFTSPDVINVFPSGDGAGGEEQTAVTIASVQQASAFGDHNIQYQFRTEGGQVSLKNGIIR